MALVLVTPPAAEPISLDTVKLDLRVDQDDEDARIQGIITAVRHRLELETQRAVITQTWDLYMDVFPRAIQIPKPPLQSIASIKYLDVDGAQQTLDASAYKVLMGEPAKVVEAYGTLWPSIRDEQDAVVVRFTAGYGNSEEDVPQDMRDWMLAHIAERYENREASASKGNMKYIDGLLGDYRVVTFR